MSRTPEAQRPYGILEEIKESAARLQIMRWLPLVLLNKLPNNQELVEGACSALSLSFRGELKTLVKRAKEKGISSKVIAFTVLKGRVEGERRYHDNSFPEKNLTKEPPELI